MALVAAVVLVALVNALPVLLILTMVLAGVVLFARAWGREFSALMRLGDDVFPGRNDKLIWALLLIVLPPVGIYLFGRFRLARWPETKAKPSTAHDYF